MNEEASRLQDGELVDNRWEVQCFLGVGELAEVYDVVDRKTHGSATLKLFAPQYLQTPDAWAKYQEHVERVRALGMPALVNPYAFGLHRGSQSPFSIAERVNLPALDQLIATVGTLLPTQFARILGVLAPLLDCAHAAGVVHRNIKPSNVYCGIQDPKGLRLGDCAVAALRRELSPYPGWGSTPGWVAPEAIDPKAVAHFTMDVYQVGLLAFFALTDRSPFLTLASFEPEAFKAELTAPMPPASARARELGVKLDPQLDGWFERALALEPEHRFRSIGEMAEVMLELTGKPRSDAAARSPRESTSVGTGNARRSHHLAGRESQPATDPGVVSASVQPLVFNTRLAQSSATADNAAVPPTSAEEPRAHVAPAAVEIPRTLPPPPLAGRTDAARQVYLAAMGTGAIALVSAVIVVGVLISERSGRAPAVDPRALDSAAKPSAIPEAAKPTPAAAPSVLPDASSLLPGASATAVVELAASPARVSFECSPVPCTSLRCNGDEQADPSSPIELEPGQHRCVGSAEGYLPFVRNLELEAGQELDVLLELEKKTRQRQQSAARQSAKQKPASKKQKSNKTPCGTFINPCK